MKVRRSIETLERDAMAFNAIAISMAVTAAIVIIKKVIIKK